MHNELLELPQRLIAFARIGVRPSHADIERAIRYLEKARSEMRAGGHGDIGLESARAALISLRHGHIPSQQVCISAVRCLGSLMSVGTVLEDA
jgi:chorismate synthase